MKTLSEIFRIACHSVTGQAGIETQYGITGDDDFLYLSIQGSVQKEDWLFNFDFAVHPYKNSPEPWFVHRGFAKCWDAAKDQIAREVAATIQGRKLVITGYSHGAAIAVMAHEYFYWHGYEPETIGYGGPRVLWMPSKKILARFEKLTLIKRRGDLVTIVPFAWMGFRHAVKQILIGKPALTWWRRHLIPEYTEALKEG